METYMIIYDPICISNDEVNLESTKYQMFLVNYMESNDAISSRNSYCLVNCFALLNKHDVEIIGLETLLVIMKRGMIWVPWMNGHFTPYNQTASSAGFSL